MAQLDFGAIEAAISAWLATATGLPASGPGSRIVARNQRTPQQAMPYLTFKVPTPRRVYNSDEIVYSYDGAQPLGQEIAETVRGQREFVCGVQAFTLYAVGGTDPNGNRTARDYVSQAQTALALPSVRDALSAAGLVYVGIESVNDFSDLLGPVGQGRAQLDVRFRCVDTAADRVGYIASVAATGAISDGASTQTVPTGNQVLMMALPYSDATGAGLAGPINGTNGSDGNPFFTLSRLPNMSLPINGYRNGIRLTQGPDYTVDQTTGRITMLAPNIPIAGSPNDTLVFDYFA